MMASLFEIVAALVALCVGLWCVITALRLVVTGALVVRAIAAELRAWARSSPVALAIRAFIIVAGTMILLTMADDMRRRHQQEPEPAPAGTALGQE